MSIQIYILLGGWVILSVMVGLYARKSKVGFLGSFLLSLLFSPPIIAMLYTFFQPRVSETGSSQYIQNPHYLSPSPQETGKEKIRPSNH